jgi:hypothetical protein
MNWTRAEVLAALHLYLQVPFGQLHQGQVQFKQTRGYRQQQRGDIARDVVTEKYILGMRILMLGYEHALRVMKESSGEGIGEFTDEFRRMAARGAASTVLALAENLPRIVDSSSVTADVE